MILTDRDVLNQIRAGNITITPYDRKRLGSNSYDLSLAQTLMIYTEDELDCKSDNRTLSFEIPKEGYVLQPGQLYLGVTNEYTACKNLVPCIEGCSSLARLGLSIHLTAGFGDVGFKNFWTLEITVVKPLRVYANMIIGQIYWTLTAGKCDVPYNMKKTAKYNNADGYLQEPVPLASKMYLKFSEELVITSK